MIFNIKNKLKSNFKYIYETFLDLIYNKKCIVCGCSKQDNFLCKTCAKDVHYLSSFAHKIYKNIPIYSVCLYNGSIKTLIHKLKFSHRKNASIPLAHFLFEYFEKIREDKDYIITFPPSYFIKSAQRGYNHMYLIAKEFGFLSKIPVEKDLIKKIKYTKPQYKAKDRRKNISNSFKINSNLKDKKLKNKTVILIDDITTSGATLEEIINCFLKENIVNIICLTVSKSENG